MAGIAEFFVSREVDLELRDLSAGVGTGASPLPVVDVKGVSYLNVAVLEELVTKVSIDRFLTKRGDPKKSWLAKAARCTASPISIELGKEGELTLGALMVALSHESYHRGRMRLKKRCDWSGTDPLYVVYHDEEWGVPVHDDRVLFEFLVLEGAQAGLSWRTILGKRDAYRRAFDRFDARKVARYDKRKVAALLADAGIVRNRAKIESSIKNARAFLDVQAEFGSFDAYQWRFVDGRPIQNRWRAIGEIPPRSAQSDTMSADLKRRGFTFVGSTIIYAHMQAVGMVNDHLVGCFRHREVARLGRDRHDGAAAI